MMAIPRKAAEMRFRVRNAVARPACTLSRSLLLGAVVACLAVLPAAAAETATFGSTSQADASLLASRSAPGAGESARRANFKDEVASAQSQEVANWVVGAADNHNLPFIIVDKVQARVFVFDAQGELRGASTALMGLAIGDASVPGIGQRKLSSIRPEERTTPAGRFVASLDRDIHGEEVLWVDYDSSVSLHKVVPGTAKERRAQRMASTSPLEKRITYGCINVPPRFYDDVVSPAFKGTEGIVYVLPETRPARNFFSLSGVSDPAVVLGSAPATPGAPSNR
jgi:hypothetical protein